MGESMRTQAPIRLSRTSRRAVEFCTAVATALLCSYLILQIRM